MCDFGADHQAADVSGIGSNGRASASLSRREVAGLQQQLGRQPVGRRMLRGDTQRTANERERLARPLVRVGARGLAAEPVRLRVHGPKVRATARFHPAHLRSRVAASSCGVKRRSSDQDLAKASGSGSTPEARPAR